jgi:hypothetical protein
MMRSSERYLVDGARARTWGVDCDVVNVSMGGLFLASVSPPPIGQPLTLELALDDLRAISLSARVVWINDRTHPNASHLPPGFGVRIQRIGLAEKLALLEFLRGLRPVATGSAVARRESARGH